MSEIVPNRHDILILLDVTNGNPNGDPDAGNMPRIDPNTNKGIITDVCLKRKIRNYVETFCPQDQDSGYQIMIHQGAVINALVDGAEEPASKVVSSSQKNEWQRAALDYLCNRFYDLRTFGAVISTGNKIFKGSAYGQVRGPVQFTFAQSFDPITPLEITVTRCAVADVKEKKQVEEAAERGTGENRTIGRKHIVPYALYAAKCYVSPAFAERTGFTQEDLDLFFQALNEMFTHDRSSARGEMIVRGIFDFEHVGTQHPNNADQNKKEARLGCCHAHKLFEGIKVALIDREKPPESFSDYIVSCEWTADNIPKGVNLHLRHEQPIVTVSFNT